MMIIQQDSLVTESTSTEWTDEKHSLYLKSMEASFVNQLYDSMNFLGWNSQKEKLSGSKSSRQRHCNICTSSGQVQDWSLLLYWLPLHSLCRILFTACSNLFFQFKVLRGGSWKKINFERPGFQLNKTDGSHCFVASPWVQHFRSGSMSRVPASRSVQGSASSKGKTNNLNVNKAILCVSASRHFHDQYDFIGMWR